MGITFGHRYRWHVITNLLKNNVPMAHFLQLGFYIASTEILTEYQLTHLFVLSFFIQV